MDKPKSKKDWVGLRVKSLKFLRNGLAKFPAGTLFTVERNWGGLHLRSYPCAECGISLFINKVKESDVVILSENAHIHGCGHPIRPVILCDNIFSLVESEYFEWKEEHDNAEEGKCLCYFCWKKKRDDHV